MKKIPVVSSARPEAVRREFTRRLTDRDACGAMARAADPPYGGGHAGERIADKPETL